MMPLRNPTGRTRPLREIDDVITGAPTPGRILLDGFLRYLGGLGHDGVTSFLAGVGAEMPERALAPHGLPCLVWLDRLAALAPVAERALAGTLAEGGDRFHWGQTYTDADFGRRFLDNYGWLELFGTRGHFANTAVAGGFLILGPEVTYPDHHHEAEEIYIPLTAGTRWRMGAADFGPRAAGEVIHHASNASHAMRTGAEPLLALYLWRGGPLAARSVVTGRA